MRRCSSLLSLSICLFGAWAIAPAAYAQAAAAKSDGKWQIPAGVVALAGGAAGVFYLGRRTGQQGAQTATQDQQTFRDYDRIFQADETPLSFSASAPAQAVAQTAAPSVAAPAATNIQPPAQPVVQTIAASQETAAPVLEAVTPEGYSLPEAVPTLAQTSAIATTTPAPLVETQRIAKGNFIDDLIKDLQNVDPTQRRRAIWDLSQRGDTRAVQPLVDLMIDSDSKQRSMILSALSEIGTRTLKPMSRALAISLQDESPDVRKNAIRDLTRVYDLMAQISQMVHQATEDPDSEVRETAQWALKQMNRFRVPEGSSNFKTSVSPPESLP